MSDEAPKNKANEAPADATDATPSEAAPAEALQFTELTDIDGRYTVEQIGEVIAAIPELEGYNDDVAVVTNFSADAMPDPETRTMMVKTSSRRGEEGVAIVSIWAIPTLQAIATISPDYVEDLVYSQLARKLTNNALRSDNPASESYPRTVNDFVTTRRGGGTSKKAFNAICKHIIDALKNAGIKMSKSDLVDAMSSKSFAEDRYAALEEKGIFSKFLTNAVAMAQRDGEDASQFQQYIETRNEVDLETVDDVDLDAISFDLG